MRRRDVIALSTGAVFCLGLGAAVSGGLMWRVGEGRRYATRKIARAEPDFRHRYAAANKALLPAKRIVLFGDSRIRGWRPLPELDEYQVVERGVAGETAAQMRYRFAQDVLDLEPAGVVIQAGIDDLLGAAMTISSSQRERIERQLIATLRGFCRELDALQIPFLLMSIAPAFKPPSDLRSLWGGDLSDQTRRLNAELSQAPECVGHWLDQDRIFDMNNDAIRSDHIHFNALYYRRLNTIIRDRWLAPPSPEPDPENG